MARLLRRRLVLPAPPPRAGYHDLAVRGAGEQMASPLACQAMGRRVTYADPLRLVLDGVTVDERSPPEELRGLDPIASGEGLAMDLCTFRPAEDAAREGAAGLPSL